MTRVEALDQLGEITDGTHYTPPSLRDGEYPFLTVANMLDGRLDFGSSARISSAEFNRAQAAGCCPLLGDVLFSKDGTVGKVHVVDEARPFAVLSSIAIIRPKRDRILSEYLSFALRSPRVLADALNRKTGTALQRLILADLRRVRVPTPPLDRQLEIVAPLTQADALRRTRRAALQLCDELLPATFIQMFGSPASDWQTSEIADLAEDHPAAIRTGPFGSQLLHSEFTASGIAVLGIDNAVNNRFTWDERRYISPEKYALLKRYTVRPGDVIITIMGTCGRCAVVPDDIPTAINTKHLCCITLDKTKIIPEFLQAAFLHSPEIKRQLRASTKGAIMDGLNMEIIKGLTLALPPLPLQHRFAGFVAQHEQLRTTHVEALRQADHLFQTLLYEAFAG